MTLLPARDGQSFDYLDIAEQIEADSGRATDALRELWTRVAYGTRFSRRAAEPEPLTANRYHDFGEAAAATLAATAPQISRSRC